jgi:AraC-like DNA-binding protein
MSTQVQFNIVVLVVLAAHQLFVVCWLLLVPREPRSAALLLALFLLSNVGCEVIDILQWLGVLRHHPWLVGIYEPWTYVMGPLFYLYTCALTPSAAGQWPRRLWPLALAPLAVLLCMTPYLLSGAAQQMAVLDDGYMNADSSIWMKVPLQLVVLADPLYSGAILLACLLRLRRHLHVVEGFFSTIANKTLSWLRWVLLLLCIALVASLVSTFAEPLLGYPLLSDTALSLIEGIWVYPLTFLALIQPPIFNSEQDRRGAVEASAPPSARKYARSALTTADLVRIAAKLQQAVGDARLYRNPALTLRDLSDQTGIPQNYISQTLNIHLGCSFFDYINRWRIEDACAQLADQQRSILAISEDVGFQSRSTFNASFKKVVGQTPTAYRQQALTPELQPGEA